jgi:hypothetical protein
MIDLEIADGAALEVARGAQLWSWRRRVSQ